MSEYRIDFPIFILMPSKAHPVPRPVVQKEEGKKENIAHHNLGIHGCETLKCKSRESDGICYTTLSPLPAVWWAR